MIQGTLKMDDEHVDGEVGKLIVRLASAAVLPMVLKSALELNVIDIIFASGGGAFLSPSEIAARIPTKNPDAPVLLDRMLRLLASHSIIKCTLRTGEDGEVERVYGAEPICKFFTRNRDGGSVAPLFLLHHDKVFMETWHHLSDVIMEGGVPFERSYGMPMFEYIGTDQRFNHIFNQAMSSHTNLIMNKLLATYKGFEGLKTLVDVGGGIGMNLKAITSKYPNIKGINLDLPHVLADAPSYSGVEHVRGDMFASVPKGDAIFIKWVLHDWGDENCVKVLKNCYESLPENGKVIVVESVLPEAPERVVTPNVVFEQDLMILSVLGGKERTQKEFEALALNSGFSCCLLICQVSNSWIMEFHKK